eukprot:scaffold18405_cov26-Tisochrysis_lutea.AAC.4
MTFPLAYTILLLLSITGPPCPLPMHGFEVGAKHFPSRIPPPVSWPRWLLRQRRESGPRGESLGRPAAPPVPPSLSLPLPPSLSPSLAPFRTA